MGRQFMGKGIRVTLIIAVALAAVLLDLLFMPDKAGLPSESLVQDSGALYLFAAGSVSASEEEYQKLKNIIEVQSPPHGHNWITETVRDASFPSDAPWRRLVGRIPAPEAVVDDVHQTVLARVKGILGIVATGCGSHPSDFEVHITAGRGISAYSMADGSIYLSYALAASLDDNEIAFALAHEIRHLRANHYRVEDGLDWQLDEPHADAFAKLAKEGFQTLVEPSDKYYDQESECDAYAAFIAAYCGFEPQASLRLINRLPEGDGRLYPPKAKRAEDLTRLINLITAEEFAKLHIPALYLGDRLKLIIGSEQEATEESKEYDFAALVLLRDAVALDMLMKQERGEGEAPIIYPGLFEVRLGVRLETSARQAATLDIALIIKSPGISGMAPASISLRALMLNCFDGWRLTSVFDTSGRAAAWTVWAQAQDKLPFAKPPTDGEMRYALDALSAWKASFTLDPSIHMLCYSQSGIEPYFDSGADDDDAFNLLALSDLFSSLEAGSEMRIFDITANKAGRGFVTISFGYTLLAGGFPVLAGNCRLGMVPEQGGWAVAGVSLY